MRRFHFDVTDSTNLQARALAGTHPGEPLLVTADVQTAGRGRHGRVWQSPRGGAWMSIVWPLVRPPAAYGAASLVVAVAVRRALCDLAPNLAADLRIKWPNDLLLTDRKVVGILCELTPARSGTADSNLAAASGILIIGVGVNVDFDIDLLPTGLRHLPTTLAAAGKLIGVDATIGAVSIRIADTMVQFESEGLCAPLLEELRKCLAYVGTIRTWETPRGSVTGRVTGLDNRGRLLLDAGGDVIACDAGELLAPAP